MLLLAAVVLLTGCASSWTGTHALPTAWASPYATGIHPTAATREVFHLYNLPGEDWSGRLDTQDL